MMYVVQILTLLVLLIFISLFLWNERRKQKYSPFTEKFLRSPGYTLGHDLDDLKGSMLFPMILVIIIPYSLSVNWFNLNQLSRVIFLIFTCGVLIFSLFKLRAIFKKAIVIRLGLEGEVYTGQELNYLMRDGAWVYHDVPYKYGNIDHIVVSTGGVFAVETKAVRKPAKPQGRAEYKVTVDQDKLIFPHVVSGQSLGQAERHAEYLTNFIHRMTDLKHTVTPVLALPGWFVEIKTQNKNVLVINPKRGAALRSLVRRSLLTEAEANRIADQIEVFARTVNSKSDINDPDAKLKYDFFNTRRPSENKL